MENSNQLMNNSSGFSNRITIKEVKKFNLWTLRVSWKWILSVSSYRTMTRFSWFIPKRWWWWRWWEGRQSIDRFSIITKRIFVEFSYFFSCCRCWLNIFFYIVRRVIKVSCSMSNIFGWNTAMGGGELFSLFYSWAT